MDRLPSLEDDGLVTPEVGDWAEDKYQLVKYYATIFSNSMSGKWGSLIYLDLFAGAGHSKIKGSGRIVQASPMVVLDIPNPFSRYIFAELDGDRISTLRARIERSFPQRNTDFVPGNCNERVDDLAALIPGSGVLTFCFVDPYNLANLRFETIKKLARNRKMDFLILLPSHMDANRNESYYIRPESTTVADFLGRSDWRSRWPHERLGFGDFVADEFGQAMAELGYLYEGLSSMQPIRSTEKNLPLYYLGFFSKNELGGKFWAESRKYMNPQRALPF